MKKILVGFCLYTVFQAVGMEPDTTPAAPETSPVICLLNKSKIPGEIKTIIDLLNGMSPIPSDVDKHNIIRAKLKQISVSLSSAEPDLLPALEDSDSDTEKPRRVFYID